MQEDKKKQVVFKATIIRPVYEADGFGIYATLVDRIQYPFVKLNAYGNASIIGELSELTKGVEYEITATEEHNKYGYQYRVSNIRRDIPMGKEATRAFLNEVLTQNQAEVLYEKYPDIIERVKENRLDDIDLSQLHGIGEYTFNKIVDKIMKNFCLSDIVAEFHGVLTLNMIRKLYNKYTSFDVLKKHLKKEPYKTLTSIDGVGFKTADAMIITMQNEGVLDFGIDIKTSVDRCTSCILYMLNENEKDGNTKMNLWDLKHKCEDLVPMCANRFYDAIEDDRIYYNVDSAEIAMNKTYIREKYIAETIINNLYNKNEWECDVSKYRNVSDAQLSDEQLRVVSNVCKYPISILNGPAGSGKSFSTQAVITMLDDLGKTYRLMSPTGKAAKVLADFTHRYASTIHRGLGYSPRTSSDTNGGWTYNENNKLHEDVVIVDEVSMIDINLFYRLVKAIDFSRTKLLMIGDNAQLPSVGCGNILHDFMESRFIPTVTLTKIFRYSDGGLMKAATDIRTGKRYLTSNMKNRSTVFGSNKDYVFLDIAPEKSINSVIAIYKKLLSEGNTIEDIQVITPKNVGKYGTVVLNNMLQVIANPNAKKKNATCLKLNDTSYYQGDLVIETKNNYKAPISPDYMAEEYRYINDIDDAPTAFVANGESGIVKNVGHNFLDIAFGDVVVRYDKEMAKMISLGYAITCHKSQGSSINNVILLTLQSDIFMLNSNIVYVGCTRARNRCFHISSVDTVNKIIKKKANMRRHTFMQQMLKECVDNMKM